MDSYEIKRYFKVILLLLAVLIAGLTLYLSQRLAGKIAEEERRKIAIWAKAEQLISDPEAEGDLSFILEIVSSNKSIPAILVDEKGEILQQINLDSQKITKKGYLETKLEEFKQLHEPIEFKVEGTTVHKVFYGESWVLRQLRYYPYYVLGVVSLFVLVSYFAFSSSRRAEQNQVWVGLAKETAHQLGTPITSLMGWIDYMEAELGELPSGAADEMRKDILRLKIITERFSRIGSSPILKTVELNHTLAQAVAYMKTRSGMNVYYKMNLFPRDLWVNINTNLFDWVIENLTKNSMDAMEGSGTIVVSVLYKSGKVIIDISDNGKGIPHKRFKTIFKPGFTSKKRGWGLGLSLAKRIIETYHKGLIFVKESIPFVRTTFRIVLSEVPPPDDTLINKNDG